MFKMSFLCLHASPEALGPLRNNIVDNLLIHNRPHTKLIIPPTLWPPNSPALNLVASSVERDVRASLADINPWFKRSQTAFVGL